MSDLRAAIRDIAEAYARRWYGVDYAPVSPQSVDADHARRIAHAYQDLPVIDHGAPTRLAYAALAREVADQYRALTETLVHRLGVPLTFLPDDGSRAYACSADMCLTLETEYGIYVYDGGADHPALSRYQNWQFRAVHDVFGHYLTRGSFGPNGEERAWRSHSQMFSPWARSAMTTETRGQNSWVNFYGDHPSLAPNARPYAVQKAALLPAWAE